MKKFAFLFAACALIAALAACTSDPGSVTQSPSTVPSVTPMPVSTPASPSSEPASDALPFETVRVTHEVTAEGVDPFTFVSEVPSFGIADVDSYFEDKANRFYNGMLEELEGGIGNPDTPYASSFTYDVTYNHGGIVSVVFTRYLNLGGAHPNVTYDCDTIDTGTVTRLTLSDIIGENGYDLLAALAAEQLSDLGVTPVSEDVTLLESVSEELGECAFALSESSLDLYFSEYAFGYPGALTVSVGYDGLREGGALADWVVG